MNLPRLLKLIREIESVAPADPYAIALMLTESEFRGPLFRFLEIIFAVYLIQTQQTLRQITLGKCQVRLKFWQEKYGSKILDLVKAFNSNRSNYEVCRHYLSQIPDRDIKTVAIFYNGRPSKLYVDRLKNNLNLVNLVLDHVQMRRELQSAFMHASHLKVERPKTTSPFPAAQSSR